MSTNKFGNDLTVGSVPKQLISFALPLFIANFIFYGYGIINTLWVGHLLGKDAVGATGVSYPLTSILVALAAGMGMGTSILMAQQFGAKNYEVVKKTVDTSVSIANVLIVVITVVLVLFSDSILRLVGTPKEIFGMASGYFKISCASFAFMYYYQLIAAMLRSIGDSVRILMLIIISTIINGVLDPLLISGFGPIPKLGLNGAAIATLIAQAFAVIFSFIYISKKISAIKLEILKFKFDKGLTKLIFKIGLPSIVQQCMAFLGATMVIIFVNGFGADAISAFGVVYKIEMLIIVPLFSVSIAVSAIMGQNLGAGKFDRIRGIFKWGIVINLVVTAVISLSLFLFPRFIMNLFINDTQVVSIGVDYLKIVSFGYLLLAVSYVANGIINGAGYTFVTMIFSFITYLIIRVPLSGIFSKTQMGLNGVWVAILLSQLVAAAISLAYYGVGGWHKKIDSLKAKAVEG